MKPHILSNTINTTRSLLVAGCLFSLVDSPVSAGGGLLCRWGEVARGTVAEDDSLAKQSITMLRNGGQQGLDALLAVHADQVTALQKARSLRQPLTPEQQRLSAAIDAVSQQYDGASSQLYWYTDLERAKETARVAGKPILSLRLLGNLTDEFSCANSRFFRTILYANEEVSKLLREQFVLHWESVRPVPKVRIDFGDGRTLERTLTGNSIHYLLNAEGRVIDALPGLYGPAAFVKGIQTAQAVESEIRPLRDAARTAAIGRFHTEQLAQTLKRWAGDLGSAGVPAINGEMPTGDELSALIAQRAKLEDATTEQTWIRLAATHSGEAQLDKASQTLIAAQQPAPTAEAAAHRAVCKSFVENPLLRAIREVQSMVAHDTIRNEYLLHTQLHAWLAGGNASASLGQLNERVYSELFLAPLSDPWLGLAPAGAYSALRDDGRHGTVAQP